MQVWQQGQFVLPFRDCIPVFLKFLRRSRPDSLMYLVAVTEFAAVVFAIVVLIKGFRLVRIVLLGLCGILFIDSDVRWDFSGRAALYNSCLSGNIDFLAING